MKLLHFAHSLEAKPFLQHFQAKIFDQAPFSGVYRSDGYYFLISGEGDDLTTLKCAAVMALLHNEIKEIYNLGAAGSLRENLKKGQCLSLRQIYHQDKFLSFATQDGQSEFDGVSAGRRILGILEKRQLSPVAHVIDREAHALGQVAKAFKRPFSSFKIITDELEEENFCQQVKEEFEPLGLKLLEYFLEIEKKMNLLKGDDNLPNEREEGIYSQLLKRNDFYFTTTQRRQLLSFEKHLGPKVIEEILGQLEKKISPEEGRPKIKSSRLLEMLRLRLYPQMIYLQEKRNEILFDLKKFGWDIHHTEDWETGKLQIRGQIQDQNQLYRLRQGLEHFNWEKWISFIERGENV